MPGSLTIAFHNQPGTSPDASRSATPGHVLTDDSQGLRQLRGGAEFDDFGVGEAQRNVPGSSVVHVTCNVRLVVIGMAEHDLAGQTPRPNGALAGIVGKASEHWRGIGVNHVPGERDGVAI